MEIDITDTMRRVATVLAGCLACWAQQQDPPTFRSTATLVEFTISALDSKGNPITDLTKDEIAVTENGKPRDVAIFRFEGGSGHWTRPGRIPAGIFTNRAERAPGPPRNVTALVLDAINTPPSGQSSIQQQLLRYLQDLPPNARVGLYRLGNQVTLLQELTGDIDALRAQVSKIDITLRPELATPGIRPPGMLDLGLGPKGGTGAEARAAMARDEAHALSNYNAGLLEARVNVTLAGLEAVGDHLAGIPGHKALVWISSGMPVLTRAAGWLKAYEPRIRKTAERLASQGVSIYPSTAPGVSSGSLDILAEITGGRVVKTMNDPAKAVAVASAGMRGAYSLGFYAVDAPDNAWRRLDVKVKRRGVQLNHRQGYLAQAPGTQPQDWSDEQWSAAAYNPIGSTNLRLEASCQVTTIGESPRLRVMLDVAAADLQFRRLGNELGADIEVGIAEKSSGDQVRLRKDNSAIRFPEARAADVVTGLARYTQNWQLNPETATVRLIARDRFTGRYGTLDIAVKDVPVVNPSTQSSALAPPPDPAVRPSTAETGRDPFIEKARATITSFVAALPNYIAKQHTRREAQLLRARQGPLTTGANQRRPLAATSDRWMLHDEITAELVYENGGESYRDIRRNGKPTRDGLEKTGAWSSGEFAGLLKDLFDPVTAAAFEERGEERIAGRAARVYDFSVKQVNSNWRLAAAGRSHRSAYEGAIWIDRETAQALKFEIRARDVPTDFPLQMVRSTTEYRLTRLASGEFLLPATAVVQSCTPPLNVCTRNTSEFRDYRVFGAESSIKFEK